jgi:hypothetical protein
MPTANRSTTRTVRALSPAEIVVREDSHNYLIHAARGYALRVKPAGNICVELALLAPSGRVGEPVALDPDQAEQLCQALAMALYAGRP